MTDAELKFLNENCSKYGEIYDAFVFLEEQIQKLILEGLEPLVLKLDLDRKNIKPKMPNGTSESVWAGYTDFGHETVKWMHGFVQFKDGKMVPKLYFYIVAPGQDASAYTKRLEEQLNAERLGRHLSSHGCGIEIWRKDISGVETVQELKNEFLALSSEMVQLLPMVLG